MSRQTGHPVFNQPVYPHDPSKSIWDDRYMRAISGFGGFQPPSDDPVYTRLRGVDPYPTTPWRVSPVNPSPANPPRAPRVVDVIPPSWMRNPGGGTSIGARHRVTNPGVPVSGRVGPSVANGGLGASMLTRASNRPGGYGGGSRKRKRTRSRRRGTPYRTKVAPSAVGTMYKRPRPRTRNVRGGVIISHTEYVTDVNSPNGSGQFQLNPFTQGAAVNPGLNNLFPWLAGIANMYESYVFLKLRFEYRARCGTGTAGTNLVVMDFDNHDQPPTSKGAMLSYANCCASNPWLNCDYVPATSDLHKRKTYFVRNSGVPANADQNLYDTGTLYVAQSGSSATAQWGEIYVHYTIKLMTPQASADQFTATGGWLAVYSGSGTTNTTVQPFLSTTVGGAGTGVATGGVVPGVIGTITSPGVVTPSATTFTFNAYYEGYLLLSAQPAGGVTFGTLGAPVTSGTATIQVTPNAAGLSYSQSTGFAAFQSLIIMYYVQASPGQTLVFNNLNGGSTKNLLGNTLGPGSNPSVFLRFQPTALTTFQSLASQTGVNS